MRAVGKQKNFPIVCVGDELNGQFLSMDELACWNPSAQVHSSGDFGSSSIDVQEKELQQTIQKEIETARNVSIPNRSEFIQKNLVQKYDAQIPNEDLDGLDDNLPNEHTTQTPNKVSSTDTRINAAYNTMNVFGRAGASVETTLRGVYNWFGWQATPSEKPIQEQRDEQNTTEMVVIHTNWYYKQQVRILKFYTDEFVRIHPITKQIKATHKYSQVEKITIRGNTYFVLYFLPQLELAAEYYEAKERDFIVELIIKRALSFKVRVTLIEVYDT